MYRCKHCGTEYRHIGPRRPVCCPSCGAAKVFQKRVKVRPRFPSKQRALMDYFGIDRAEAKAQLEDMGE